MFKSRFHLSSKAFIVLISAYFSLMLSVKFWQFVYEKVEINSVSSLFFALSLPIFMFVPLYWLFNLIVVPYVGRWLAALMLVCSAASDFALQNLGVVINSEMIRNFVETTQREAADFFTLHAVFYVLIAGGVPAVLVGLTKIEFKSFVKELRQRLLCVLLSALVLAVGCGGSYKQYVSFGRNNKQVRYYVNTFNYIYAVAYYWKHSEDAQRKLVILDAMPKIAPSADGKPRVLVLVVGETARAQNFSLYGYAQDTNPMLAKNKEIVVFGDVSSCGTSTAVSLPCMFSKLTRKQFDVTDAQYMQNLLDIAKAAGYDVIWKDNDDGCKKVCDKVGKIDARFGNKQPYCFGDYCHDDILLDGLEAQLNHISQDTLIVLHAMGSHGPTYYKRYPERFNKFMPACETANLQDCNREQIVNTYNNTIVYTDYVVASVIEILQRHGNLQSGMLYVSDHGESLGENNIYLHGLPYAFAPEEQKKVPMILWLSSAMQKSMRLDMSCLRRTAGEGHFSHDNYFHSVLRLLQIQTSAFEPQLNVFAPCEK